MLVVKASMLKFLSLCYFCVEFQWQEEERYIHRPAVLPQHLRIGASVNRVIDIPPWGSVNSGIIGPRFVLVYPVDRCSVVIFVYIVVEWNHTTCAGVISVIQVGIIRKRRTLEVNHSGVWLELSDVCHSSLNHSVHYIFVLLLCRPRSSTILFKTMIMIHGYHCTQRRPSSMESPSRQR